jgi:hypothetical protein
MRQRDCAWVRDDAGFLPASDVRASPGEARRTLDHLARRSRYDQAHARSVENNGQIGDPGLAPILFGGLPKALAAISECV